MDILDKIKSRAAAFLHDLLMIPIAWMLAFWFRFNLSDIPESFLSSAFNTLPLILFIQGASFWVYGLYRGVWKFASMPDVVRIVKAVITGVLIAMAVIFVLTRLTNVPRSVFPIYAVLLLLMVSGPRLVYRWLNEKKYYIREGKRTLIIGAGSAGEILVRDLIKDDMHAYKPVGFIDDDSRKTGKEIHGIRVYGNNDQIGAIVKKLYIENILIAVPSATASEMQRIVESCEEINTPFQTLPRIQEIISGQVSRNELREVSIGDLLGRDTFELDWSQISVGLANKTVFVTGAGGSIGSELSRQVASLLPARLIVMDHSEYNLYNIEKEINEQYPNLNLTYVLGSVLDTVLLENIYQQYSPDMVFHAAAYKHVPLLENHTRSAALNNIIGTRNVAGLAEKYGIGQFLLVSTDKAVNPTNLMGSTKRIAELYVNNLARSSNTTFIIVRFGNVLGSAGSVLPLFQQQIKDGGPVTVTHPHITRYFMTIPEACQLILQANAIGSGGEIFVLNMGDPIKIDYMARQMIMLSGKVPDEDIVIKYTGLRAGEKLYEELFYDSEKIGKTRHPMIFQSDVGKITYDHIEEVVYNIERCCEQYDENGVQRNIDKLVPSREINKTIQKHDNVIDIKDRLN